MNLADISTAKIKKFAFDNPRGYLRRLILGEKKERGEAIGKGLLYGVAAVFVATFVRGFIISGGEPLGDLELAHEAAPDAPTLYQMQPYHERIRVPGDGRAGGPSKPTRFVGLELFQRPAVPIPAGLFVKAVLVTGAAKGGVEAKVIKTAASQGETSVPAGSRLFGTASVSDARVIIQFTKLKRPNGSEEAVSAQAYDPQDKTAGLRTSRFGYELKKFVFGTGLNFAAGLAEGFQDTTAQNGATYKPGTVKNAFLNGARDAARGQAQEVISDMRGNRPTPTVPSNTQFLVGFD